jgi:hypothetical protein
VKARPSRPVFVGEMPDDRIGRAILNFAAFALALLIVREGFAATIRFYASPAWYVPDGLALLALAAMLGRRILRVQLYPWALLVIVTACVAWSYLLGHFNVDVVPRTPAIVFSLRLLMPALLGFEVAPFVMKSPGACRLFLGTVLVCIAAGLLIDNFVSYPWRNMAYQGFEGRAAQTKEWYLEGVRRLNGFGLSSMTTAAVVSTLVVALAALMRNRALIILFAAIGTYAIFATTQRAALASTLLVVIALLAPTFVFRGDRAVSAQISFLKLLAITALILDIVAPLVATAFKLLSDANGSMESVAMRTTDVWPQALLRFRDEMNPIFGAGIGAIGSPAGLVPGMSTVAPDNVFLYMTMMIGLTSLFLFIAAALLVIRTPAQRSSLFGLSLLALFAINGITANIYEAMGSMCFLGLAVGQLLTANPTSSSRTKPSASRPQIKTRVRPQTT